MLLLDDLDDHPRLPLTLRPGLRAVVRAHQGLSPIQAMLPAAGLLSDLENVEWESAEQPTRRVAAYLWNAACEILGILGHHMPGYYLVRMLVTSPAQSPPLPEACARVVRRWLGTSCDCTSCTVAAIAIATETMVWMAQTYLRSLLQDQRARWARDFSYASAHYVAQMRHTCWSNTQPACTTREGN
jgi:hypothetical protein